MPPEKPLASGGVTEYRPRIAAVVDDLAGCAVPGWQRRAYEHAAAVIRGDAEP